MVTRILLVPNPCIRFIFHDSFQKYVSSVPLLGKQLSIRFFSLVHLECWDSKTRYVQWFLHFETLAFLDFQFLKKLEWEEIRGRSYILSPIIENGYKGQSLDKGSLVL